MPQSDNSSLWHNNSKSGWMSRGYVALLVFLLIGLALRVGLALHFPSVHHPDEVFQTLEPAHRLAYGYGVIHWEWRVGVRSWVFPAFLAGIMRATDWMGPGSSGYLLGIVIVLSAISLIAVWFSFAWAKRASGIQAAIIAAGASAIWWELVFFAPKALNEVIGGHLFLLGLYLGVHGDELPKRRRLFLAGLFCGLAVSLRIQLAPAVLFAALYFCYPKWRERILPVFGGLLLPVLAFGLVDAFTWSYPFQSFFLYFWVNVVRGRATIYGTEPWYWYLFKMAKHFGPMLILALLGARRSPFLGWIALFILVPLLAISHKEVRFIYPIVPIMITLSALGIGEIADRLSLRMGWSLPTRRVVLAGLVFCAVTSGFIGMHFTGWGKGSGDASAFDRLSRESVCGVGIYPVYPVDDPDPNHPSHPGPGSVAGGGYAHLHHNVPIVAVSPDANLGEPSSFNALLSLTGSLGDAAHDFKLEQCWGERPCVYRMAGACTAASEENLANAVLERAGR